MENIKICSSSITGEKLYSFFWEKGIDFSYDDYYIASSLNMSQELYQEKLIKTFNGKFYQNNKIVFNNEHDMLNALDWINSILVAKTLCKSK